MHPIALQRVGRLQGHAARNLTQETDMKTLLTTTTALALLVSGPLLAQQAQPEVAQTPVPAQQAEPATPMADAGMAGTGGLFLPMSDAGVLHASELIGMAVHSSEADYATYGANPVADADRSQWDAIGEINDILISRDGEAQGVLVDIGGFLGMGQHTVALDMSQVHFLRDEGGVEFVAVNSTREALENAPAYERQDEMAATPMDPAAPAPSTEMAQPAADPAADPALVARPTFTREGYTDVDYAQLTAEDLQGASIYDGNDDNIGDISELVISADGAIDQVIVDVGGFLGIGAHTVALDFDELQILRADDGGFWVYVDQTRENLEQRPAYEG
jgi:hypothetical protein